MWLSPDVAPIFFADVFVDLDGGATGVRRVAPRHLGLRVVWTDELLRVPLRNHPAQNKTRISGTRGSSSFRDCVRSGF